MINVLLLGGSGYIGSSLVSYLRNFNLKIKTVDLNWFNGPQSDINSDFNILTDDFLKQFTHIILLAGHSSMSMCNNNYSSAWNNNVTNFSYLLSKLNCEQTLIYASSGSVYGEGGTGRKEFMTLPTAHIEYDLTKQIIEKIAYGAKCKTIGLRFGTVNGYSTYARSDLLLNLMTIKAIENKKIDCYNGNNFRSILGINDCVRAIKKIIDEPKIIEHHEIFNLASFSGTISTFAENTAKVLNVKVISHVDITNRFSFQLDCGKFSNLYDFKFNDTLENIVQEIVKNYSKIIWSDRMEKIHYV